MTRTTWAALTIGLALALVGAACSSTPKAGSSPQAINTAYTPLPSPSSSPLPSPIPCASSATCFHHGTIQVNITGATTTAFTASLDDVVTVVTPTVATLVYANTHGQGATVGALKAKPGAFPQGAAKVLVSRTDGFYGLCPVTFDHLSAAGADGSFNCPSLGPLLGATSTGTVSVTGTFSAAP